MISSPILPSDKPRTPCVYPSEETFHLIDETTYLSEVEAHSLRLYRVARSLLLGLKQEGVTILLASHNPDDIRPLCNTVHEMDAGVLSPVQAFF